MTKKLFVGALLALASTGFVPLSDAAAQGAGGSAPPSGTDSQQGDPTVTIQGNAPSGVNAGGGGASSGSGTQTLPLVALGGALAAITVVTVARNRAQTNAARS